jgi:hypothetical protein
VGLNRPGGRERGWPVWGSGGVRRFSGGRGGFGGVLACAVVHCGVVTSVLACLTGQRRGREMGGGSGCVSPFLPGLTAGVWAGETGSRQRGERGCRRVRLGRLGRTAVASYTVSLVFRISAQNVFDTMPA